MAAVDMIRPYEREGQTAALSSFLTEQTQRNGIELLEKRTNTVTHVVEISEKEKIAAKEKENSFPEELRFSVKVNLMESKKAYLALMEGLNDEQMQSTLMNLYPHNPHTYPCPIGDVDFSFLSSQGTTSDRTSMDDCSKQQTANERKLRNIRLQNDPAM